MLWNTGLKILNSWCHAMVSTSINFTAFQQPWLRRLGGHDQLLHLHENWTKRLQRLILDMCSARACFLPCFPLACLLNLILSFLVASFILLSFLVSSLLSWFSVLFFVFCFFCSDCRRFYCILFPIVLLLFRVLRACLSFLFSLSARARSHGWLILDRSSQQASAAFSLFDVFMVWRASHAHENTIASSATRIRPKEVKCDAV